MPGYAASMSRDSTVARRRDLGQQLWNEAPVAIESGEFRHGQCAQSRNVRRGRVPGVERTNVHAVSKPQNVRLHSPDCRCAKKREHCADKDAARNVRAGRVIRRTLPFRSHTLIIAQTKIL